MKRVAFVKIDRGGRSAETIAEDCRRRGRLLSIVRDPFLNGVRKYYQIEGKYEDRRPIEITDVGGKIVSARRVPEAIIKTLPPLYVPEFGNF